MYSRVTSPLSIGSVLDSGFSLFRHSIKETFGFAFASSLFTTVLGRGVASPDGSVGAIHPVVAVFAFIAMLVATLIPSIAIVAKIHAVQNGGRLCAAGAVRVGLRRFFPALGVMLLYSMLGAVGYFVLLRPAYLLLLIPGIYALVVFVFSFIAVITEPKGVFGSFRYSYVLIRGRWWRTALLLGIVTIVVLVLFLFVSIVLGVVLSFEAAGSPDNFVVPWYLELVVAPLVSGVVMPLVYALLMAIYADAKLRYEGTDLAERIAAADA